MLVVAFSLQAFIIPILAAYLVDTRIARYLLFYYILPVILTLDSLLGIPIDSVLSIRFAALTVVTLSMALSGFFFMHIIQREDTRLKTTGKAFFVIAGVYFLSFIWHLFHGLESIVGYGETVSRMIILFLYTIIGLTTYLTGDFDGKKLLKRYGLGVILLVLARLLLVEVWEMELTTRIITFFCIGVVMIFSILIRKKRS